MFSTVRRRAIAKLLLLVAAFWLVRLLQPSGSTGSSRLQALHVVPLVFCIVPALELLLGTPFMQISARWNTYSSLRQWGTLLVVVVALFAGFIGLAAVFAVEP